MLDLGPSDWEGLWFEFHESECRDNAGIRFGHRARESAGEPSWHFLPHSHYDGIGGMAHLLRERAQGDIARELPRLRESSRPGLLSRIWLVLKTVARKPLRVARWKAWDSKWRPPLVGLAEVPTALAQVSLSQERTRELSAQAQGLGVSLNSLLFSALAQTCAPEFEEGPQLCPQLWMIPVNMRGLVPPRRDTANYASFVQVEHRAGVSAKASHLLITGALRRRDHWGIWLSVAAVRVFGKDALKRLFRRDRKMGRAWVGTFSNIGVWDGVGEDWFFCPPAVSSLPLAAGAVICDGRLALTLQAHQALATDPAWARELIERWLKEMDRTGRL